MLHVLAVVAIVPQDDLGSTCFEGRDVVVPVEFLGTIGRNSYRAPRHVLLWYRCGVAG